MTSCQMMLAGTEFMCLAHSSTPDWSMEHLGAVMEPREEEAEN